MREPIRSACFTGPRPERFAACGLSFAALEPALRDRLQDEIIRLADRGCTAFFCGMARGVDLLAGETLLALQPIYPQLQLIAVLPFPRQAYYWEDGWIARYNRVLHRCREIRTVAPRYQAGCYALRNRYLVDHSDRVIAVVLPEMSGGTAMTLRYAAQQNKPVIQISYNCATTTR